MKKILYNNIYSTTQNFPLGTGLCKAACIHVKDYIDGINKVKEKINSYTSFHVHKPGKKSNGNLIFPFHTFRHRCKDIPEDTKKGYSTR